MHYLYKLIKIIVEKQIYIYIQKYNFFKQAVLEKKHVYCTFGDVKLALDSFHHRLGCCCRCKKAGAKSNAKNIGAGVENRWCCVCAKSEVGEKKKAKIKKQFRTLSKKKYLGHWEAALLHLSYLLYYKSCSNSLCRLPQCPLACSELILISCIIVDY